MIRKNLGLLATITLAAHCPASAQATTINFPSLNSTTSLAALNDLLAGTGVSVDAGYPSTVVVGGGQNLQANTDPAASDLLFNFSTPVNYVSLVTVGNGGYAVGANGFSINTTAALGPSTPGPDNIAYQGGIEGDTLTLSQTGILSVQIEDEGTVASIASLTFTPAPAPEPATGGLLALGTLSLAGARFRRPAK